ncbi:sensor histidine kinase [Paenibacillus swuensis]|uniref:sensor histidine kinase n=1 Tax=Paenibacillus swuensis TaxID=1178515 RepID=UPI001E63A720|nr:HAMP domain-containing sensor histidine kinase [Paenibacillus swuensis]
MRLKFIAFLALLLMASLGVLTTMVLSGIRNDQRNQMEAVLERQTEIANLQINQAYYTGPKTEPDVFIRKRGQELARNIATYSGMPAEIYSMEGQRVGRSVPGADRTDLTTLMNYALQNKVVYVQDEASATYLAPVTLQDQQAGVLEFKYSLQNQNAFYRTIQNLFWTTGGAVLLSSFVLGYLYFSGFSRAIIRLKETANQIQRGAYISKPPIRRKDELGELGEGIFFMSSEIEKNIRGMEAEQEKLKLAVRKLQALERQQKQFIGNISHEFKTPLTSIRAYTDLMSMYKDDPKLTNEAVENIDKESLRLLEMVEKALHLSALEKYDFEEQAESVDLAYLVKDVAGRMRGKAEKFGLTLELDLHPALVWADRESLMHIVVNLLDNAIKYNQPKGRITIRIRIVDGERVELDVYNTGQPIPEASRDLIFEAFYTVNKDRARQSGGTGLGLSITKQLVEKQNGTLALVSSSSEGTLFRIGLSCG